MNAIEEGKILGCLVVEGSLCNDYLEKLKPQMFTYSLNKSLLAAIIETYRSGERPSVVSVSKGFHKILLGHLLAVTDECCSAALHETYYNQLITEYRKKFL